MQRHNFHNWAIGLYLEMFSWEMNITIFLSQQQHQYWRWLTADDWVLLFLIIFFFSRILLWTADWQGSVAHRAGAAVLLTSWMEWGDLWHKCWAIRLPTLTEWQLRGWPPPAALCLSGWRASALNLPSCAAEVPALLYIPSCWIVHYFKQS